MKQSIYTLRKAAVLTALAVLCQIFAFATAFAEPAPIKLSNSDTFYQPLVRHLQHAQDDDLALDLKDILSGALQFSPVETPYADFDLGPARHWLWAKVINENSENGVWRVDIRRQYMQELTIYAVRDGGRSEIFLAHTDRDIFEKRQIDSRFLQTDLAVNAGETVDIYIAYRSTSVSYIPPAIGTIDGVAKDHLGEFTIDAIFNGGLLAMLVLTLLLMPIVGWKLSASFCAYIIAGMLFVLHADSYTFQYVWPNSPHFNDTANLGFMLLMPVFGLAFARTLFRTRAQYPYWDKVIFGYICVAASLALLAPAYVHMPTIMALAYAFVPVGTLIQLFTGISMAYRGLIGSTPYLLGAIGVTISFAYAVIAHLQPGYWSLDRTLDVGHASILLECFAFASAIVLRMVAIRNERDTALKKELAEAQLRLKAEKALRKSQADFAYANKLSEDRLNQLASVSHDLQAPLKALRRVVGQMGNSTEAGTGRMHAALDYLEDLARLELAKGAPNSGDKSESIESFPVTVITDNIAELFAARAVSKNISLRHNATSLIVTAEPVSLMRIVSNLVSNAIEHAQATKILLATRKRDGKVIIQVWDNGVGIAPNEQSAIFKRGHKGAASAGNGLGLSIVADECSAQGITFDLCSKKGRGTRVALAISTQQMSQK